MSGTFSAGGLITGLDSESLIRSLIQLERQPIRRIRDRISQLETQQTAIRGLRTTLQTLRNAAQDFRLNNIFNAYASTSSKPEVLTSSVSSSTPVTGAFTIDVQQLATATTAVSGGAIGAPINSAATLDSSGIVTEIAAGTFTINGVQFNVDPASDSLDSVLSAINSSAAGVTATYDSVSDTVTIANTAAGDGSIINFGASSDTSNLLSALNVAGATQLPDVNGSTSVTSTRNLGAVDPAQTLNEYSFRDGALTAGTFSINGVSIAVDPSSQSLFDVLGAINESGAGVNATYDSATDQIRVVSKTLGSPTIRFGGAGDTSNFLDLVNLDTAVQTAGANTQFTVNGGPLQTRNTTTITDAIGGVTLELLSAGTSTITISNDNDAIVEEIRGFVENFNTALSELRNQLGANGNLRGDSGIRSIESFLVNNIFQQVAGLGGDFESLLDLGISSGADFNSEAGLTLSFDEDKFREALLKDRLNVQRLFANDGENGIADKLFTFLDSATRTNGFLNERIRANGTIDQQIQTANDQIARLEERLEMRETRLRRQFTALEQISAVYQNQAAALSRIGSFR